LPGGHLRSFVYNKHMSFESYKEPNKLELLPSISEGIEAERQNIDEIRMDVLADTKLSLPEKKTLLFQLKVEEVLTQKQARFTERLQQAA
jgi:hypothetical protein